MIVSSLGAYTPFPMIAPYSISKTSLVGMTKAMAPACAALGIRVNCIAPGIIRTNFSRALWEGNEEMFKDESSEFMMKRVGEPDEIGGTAVFLASDDASYITGETIIVAGGVHARL